MTVSAINPFLPSPPDVGTSYGNIMDAFFSTLSDGQKQQIWVNFLKANNLTDPVPPGQEQLFLTFIQQQIASNAVQVPSYVNDTLSPDEVKKRNITFGVLNSVLNMLLALQNTVTVEAQDVAFYGKWQKAYTDMLTRVPTYIGGEASNVHVDLNDLSKFTLGYNDISVEDIAKWWAQERIDGKNDTFSISTYTTLSATETQYVTINFSPSGIDWSITSQGTNSGGTLPQAVVTASAGATFDQSVTNYENAFKTFWIAFSGNIAAFSANQAQAYVNAFPSAPATIQANTTDTTQQKQLVQAQIFAQTAKNTDPYVNFEILKPYTYVAPANITQATDPKRTLSDAASKARAEINSRDQQYIENIRSLRQTVQDQQQQIQANLDQSRQTIPQQADLFNSIIDSLKGILASIYR